MKYKWLGLLFFIAALLLFSQPLWAALKASVDSVGAIPTLSKYASNVSLATVKIYYYDDVKRENKPWAENGQPVTIWLPGEVTYVKVPTEGNLKHYAAVENEGINLNFVTAGENFLTVSVTNGADQVKDTSIVMYVYFNDEYSKINTGEISGELKVLVEAPGTVFDLKECVVGKTAGQGVSIESRGTPVISPDTTSAKAGQIKIFENCPGAVKAGSEIILTVSKGVIFAKVEMIPYLGWTKKEDIEVRPIDLTAEGLSRVKLKVKKDTSTLKYGGAVLLDIWYDVPTGLTGKEIKVTLVRTSEVVVIGVNEVVNAKMADLGAEISAEDPTTASIFAGRTGTAATIILEENKAGSLIQNRTIKFTLPDDITWNDRPTVVVTTGNIKLDGGIISSDKRTVTFIITAASTSASTIEFCEPKYDVEPDVPPGGVKVTIGGSAGVSGEVINAEVCEPFSITAEKTEMRAGLQNQEAGALTITETKERAFMKESPTQNGKIILTTPAGVTIKGTTKVSVTEGNVKIDQEGIRLMDLGEKSRLTIEVTAESTKASTIEISGLKYILSMAVPEGDIVIIFSGSAMHTIGDEVYKAANATCVTSALGGTSKLTSVFVIGNKTYTLGGVEQEKDVAPYIKNGRTYGPIRYNQGGRSLRWKTYGFPTTGRETVMSKNGP